MIFRIAPSSSETNPGDDHGVTREKAQPFILFLILPALFLWLALPSKAQDSVTVAWTPNAETTVAGYKVFLGTSSGGYSSSQSVTSGTSAVLSGLKPGTKYFCAVQAYDKIGQTSDLSQEITFTTRPRIGFFSVWAVNKGLVGAAADPMARPFQDGVPNLLKYAFNLNGGAPDNRVLPAAAGTAGLPLFRVDRTNSGTWFEVQYLRLRSGELAYQPKISTDLVNYTPMTGTISVAGIDADWERVTQRMAVNPAATPKLFGTVEVSQAQTPASVFTAWAAASGLSGAAALPGAMPRADGVSNLLKYAFNLNPSAADSRVLQSATGTAGLPLFTLASGSPQRLFKVEYLRRKNSGLVYSPEISTDMVRFTAMQGSPTVASIDDDWERVTLSMAVDPALTPKLFGRVSVSLP